MRAQSSFFNGIYRPVDPFHLENAVDSADLHFGGLDVVVENPVVGIAGDDQRPFCDWFHRVSTIGPRN